jgi:hypothetical protein
MGRVGCIDSSRRRLPPAAVAVAVPLMGSDSFKRNRRKRPSSATEQELERLKGVRAGRVGGTDRAPNHINLFRERLSKWLLAAYSFIRQSKSASSCTLLNIAWIARLHSETLFPLRQESCLQEVVGSGHTVDSRQTHFFHQTVLQSTEQPLDAPFCSSLSRGEDRRRQG